MVGYNMRMPGPIPKQLVWKKDGYFWFLPQDVNIPPKKPLIHLIPRDEWGALPAKSETPMKLPLNHIRYNQTMTDTCIAKEDCIKIVKDIQKQHLDKGLPDIKYNFLIGGDGTFYEGRGWNNKPEIHAALKDKDYYDVAYIGKYGDDFPSWDQSVAGTKFIKFGLEKEYINRGHGITNLMEISD
uniref:Peptidoglycan recognition protein 15 n=1 Tax=Nephotettix cincticeps TaxID=94400 RepID=A0A5H2X3R8_NEPCI|nr:peptidoglycan recognition protein 15 [Nephotettix cincticeps]